MRQARGSLHFRLGQSVAGWWICWCTISHHFSRQPASAALSNMLMESKKIIFLLPCLIIWPVTCCHSAATTPPQPEDKLPFSNGNRSSQGQMILDKSAYIEQDALTYREIITLRGARIAAQTISDSTRLPTWISLACISVISVLFIYTYVNM